MKKYKIIISGPFAAGKTTFIQTITEIAPISTEAKTTKSDETKVKDSTTVAMDFGRITIDGENVLHIFGTPGQFRFNYMWSILGKDALGIVVIIDSGAEDTFEDAKDMINFFRVKTDAPILVALNQFDGKNKVDEEEIRKILNLPKWIPVVECNAKDKESVKGVLTKLLGLILAQGNVY
ncbi:MAG: ATP/GTP-binding protein [Caldisericaceae bacterium]|nr:ATP/GTP-binding protein [Caldisericaceae bacterium]